MSPSTIALHSEPFQFFKEWYNKAQGIDLQEPTAMVLSTATPDGKPSSRVVLLKHYDERGFCFFTNVTSRKGKELKENPYAALNFFWMPLKRQVRIEGIVERVTDKEADDYFTSRSRGSQLGAWASKQSMPMGSEEELPNRVLEITEKFSGGPIPRPPFWSGFRVIPTIIEFWEEREFRLHKRVLYTKALDGWKVDILYP